MLKQTGGGAVPIRMSIAGQYRTFTTGERKELSTSRRFGCCKLVICPHTVRILALKLFKILSVRLSDLTSRPSFSFSFFFFYFGSNGKSRKE